MLLSVNNLEVRYGGIRALQGVTLHIDRGEIVTLIGANGAGKTTLLRTISGLLRPAAGSITWDSGALPVAGRNGEDASDSQSRLPLTPALSLGEREQMTADRAATATATATGSGITLDGMPPHEIVRLGVSHVPEGRQIFATLTVRENLLLGAYQRRAQHEINADIQRCFAQFPVL